MTRVVFRERRWNQRVIWPYFLNAFVPFSVVAFVAALAFDDARGRIGAAWLAVAVVGVLRFTNRTRTMGVYVDTARRKLKVVNPWRTYRFSFSQINEVVPHVLYGDTYVTEIVTTFEKRPFLAIGVRGGSAVALSAWILGDGVVVDG